MLEFSGTRLSDLRQARGQAAQQGIRLQTPNLTFEVDDSAKEQTTTVSLSDGLPLGTASLYLQDRARHPIPLLNAEGHDQGRLGVAIADEPKIRERKYTYQIDNDAHLTGVTRLQAVALYRGNVFPRSFNVDRSVDALDIVHVRTQETPPRLTVFGQSGHSRFGGLHLRLLG